MLKWFSSCKKGVMQGCVQTVPSPHKNTTLDHNKSIFSSEYIGYVYTCIRFCAYDMSFPHGKSPVLFLAMPLVILYRVWWCKIAPWGVGCLDHVIYCKPVVYVVMFIYGNNDEHRSFLAIVRCNTRVQIHFNLDVRVINVSDYIVDHSTKYHDNLSRQWQKIVAHGLTYRA